MAVRPARLMEERMKEMLLRDKASVNAGFVSALTSDLARVAEDYFVCPGRAEVTLERTEDGSVLVGMSFSARGVKAFATTEELPVPETE